jgi:hypothetical protein
MNSRVLGVKKKTYVKSIFSKLETSTAKFES